MPLAGAHTSHVRAIVLVHEDREVRLRAPYFHFERNWVAIREGSTGGPPKPPPGQSEMNLDVYEWASFEDPYAPVLWAP